MHQAGWKISNSKGLNDLLNIKVSEKKTFRQGYHRAVITYCSTLDMIEFTSNIVSNSSANNGFPILKTSANQTYPA